MVEVRGIEPRSGDANPGILRVQFANRFSQLSHARKQGVNKLSHLKVPMLPMTNNISSGSLVDARNRDGSNPGLTDSRYLLNLGSKSEVGAL